MKIEINGKDQDFDELPPNLLRLLTHLGVEAQKGVAVAVNDQVIPKSKWDQKELEVGDRVEIIKAAQGG